MSMHHRTHPRNLLPDDDGVLLVELAGARVEEDLRVLDGCEKDEAVAEVVLDELCRETGWL